MEKQPHINAREGYKTINPSPRFTSGRVGNGLEQSHQDKQIIRNVPKSPKDWITPEQLAQIRDSINDPVRLLGALGIEIDRQDATHYWIKSPFRDESQASLHIEKTGDLRWYDFGSGEGGAPLELIQKMLGINIYAAGKWAVDNGLGGFSSALAPVQPSHQRSKKKEEFGENKSIRQNLIPLLSEMGTHPEFVKRGISKATCEYLGCGYLALGTMKKPDNPMYDRIVFQVRSIMPDKKTGELKLAVLAHVGQALSQERADTEGRFWTYKGFKKSLELYNLDNLVLDEMAKNQVQETGHIIVVEGFFDAAKLIEAGIHNVVATMGANLSQQQVDKMKLICRHLPSDSEPEFLMWYDRDQAGINGQEKALELIQENGLKGRGFDWQQQFESDVRRKIILPESINDPCDFSVAQLQWLREWKIC